MILYLEKDPEYLINHKNRNRRRYIMAIVEEMIREY